MNQSQKFTLRETEMAYTDVGNGPAVLLLHGFPFDRSMWRDQIHFLSARGYHVIAPDLRGLGETTSATAISTIEDMAQDAAALLDYLQIECVVVGGLSMGVYVAFEFASLFPSRVSALVLAGGRALPADDAEKKSREEQATRVIAEGMSFAVDSILTNLLATGTLANKPDVVERIRTMILCNNPRGAAAAQLGMAARRDYSGDLAQIKVPTLIIAGREDGVRKPEDAELIHEGIKDSRLKIIDDAGHLMNMEQPEIFNRAMLDFLGLIQ
jgi:3-oxoadipate enol-lactonase